MSTKIKEATEQKVNMKALAVKFLTNEKIGAMLILIAMFLYLGSVSDAFFTSTNLLNLFRFAAPYMVVGCGVLAVLMAGGMDMSTGSTMGLAGMVTALNLTNGQPVWLSILLGLLVGALVGAINGFLVGYVGLQPFISTMGTKLAVSGITTLLCGGFPVNGLPDSFNLIGSGRILGVYNPIWISLLVAIIMAYIIGQTTFGRQMAAVGGNANAAKVSGISVAKTKMFSYMLCGVCAAMAGIIITARVKSGQASTGYGYEMTAIAGVVIGGASMKGGSGTVFGCVCGSLVMATMVNGMDMVGVNAYWQDVAQGLIIVIAVALDVLRKKVRK